MKKLRNITNNAFAKILLVLIAISFILVGTGGSFNDNTIASVDDTEINRANIQNLYKNTISSPRFKDLSTNQLKSMGIAENLVQNQISLISIYSKADNLGISISDNYVVKKLTDIETFHSLGRFDKLKFQQILAANNLSVQQFTTNLRREEVANRYSTTFTKIPFSAKNIENLLNRNDAQTRDIITAEIAINSIPVTDATDEKLKEIYDNNKARFTVAETRNVEILEISPKSVAKNISDKQAEDFYAENKKTYEKPELRDYYIIPGEKQQLIEIKKLVEKGTEIKTAVKDVLNLEYSDLLNKNKDLESTDKTLQQTVFNSEIGKVSEPIDMILNNVVVVVEKISKGEVKSFKDLKSKIKTDIATAQILDLVSTAEDELAEGKSINEIAEELNIKTYLADKVSKSGLPMYPVTTNKKVIDTIYSSPLDEPSFPVEINENNYVIVTVNKINPKYTPKFDKFKGQIKTAYANEQRNKKVQSLIGDMKKTKSESEFISKAKQLSLKVKNKNDLKKSAQADASIFKATKQEVNSYQKAGVLTVFYVKAIKIPLTADKATVSPLVDELNKVNKNQILYATFTNIRENQNIEVNDAMVRSVYQGQ